MAINTNIRNKLATKVFANGKLASTGTLYSVSSVSYDEYGSPINKVESSSSIKVVPYNLISKVNYSPFGDIQEGESDVIIKYDTNVSIGDKLSINSVDYEVKQIENYLVEDEIVAKALRIAKIQN